MKWGSGERIKDTVVRRIRSIVEYVRMLDMKTDGEKGREKNDKKR